MVHVRVEFWLQSGSGKEWGPDFESLADRRPTLNLSLADGTTVRALFEDLERYPVVRRHIFSDHAFHSDLTLTLNSQVMGFDELYGQVLGDGDKISVLPMYAGA